MLRRSMLTYGLTAFMGSITAEAGQGGATGSVCAGQAGQGGPGRPARGESLQFYGFIRQDVLFDDSRPDAAQTPLFILSEPAGAANRENFTMHPRLTRFGVNLAGPALASMGGARLSGKLEIDFQNGGRESRAIPRYRHAYMTLSWNTASLLAGQTWDLISPLLPAVNADTLMWNAGNLGDRRPQIRASVQPRTGRLQWSLAAAAGLTGAVDQQDLDSDGVRDGEAAGVPNVQGRVGVTYPIGARWLGLGVWAQASRLKVATAIASETGFPSHTVGLDLELPLGRRAVIRGEAWTGSNLSDVRGGIGQAINRATGDGIDSNGGWVEIGGDLTPAYALFAGYTNRCARGGRCAGRWAHSQRRLVRRQPVLGRPSLCVWGGLSALAHGIPRPSRGHRQPPERLRHLQLLKSSSSHRPKEQS